MSDRICIASNGTVNAHISALDLLSCCRSCGLGYAWVLCRFSLFYLFCQLNAGILTYFAIFTHVEARIRIGWNKFKQLVPLLTNKDVSLIMTGRLYSSCVQSSMLHGSETWPVSKENVMALQRAEMRMVRWMCGIKLNKTDSQVRSWKRD